MGKTLAVDDGATEPIDEVLADPSADAAPGVGWGLDAAVGAAALAGQVGVGVASAVVASPPAKVAAAVGRRLSAPLARRGREVRQRVADEAGPAVGGAVRQFAPGVVDAVDLDALLAQIDLDALLGRIDIDGLLDRVGIDRLLARIDVDALMGRVDVNALMSRVDVGALLDSVDLDALLTKVDLDALLASVDLDALLGRLDLEALLTSVDINAVVAKVDIDELVRSTELGAIIAQSTSGVASEALDAARSQGVSLDNVLGRVVDRVLRRSADDVPAGPPLLIVPPSTDGPVPEPTSS